MTETAAGQNPFSAPEPPLLAGESETLEGHAGQLDILVELLDGRPGE